MRRFQPFMLFWASENFHFHWCPRFPFTLMSTGTSNLQSQSHAPFGGKVLRMTRNSQWVTQDQKFGITKMFNVEWPRGVTLQLKFAEVTGLHCLTSTISFVGWPLLPKGLGVWVLGRSPPQVTKYLVGEGWWWRLVSGSLNIEVQGKKTAWSEQHTAPPVSANKWIKGGGSIQRLLSVCSFLGAITNLCLTWWNKIMDERQNVPESAKLWLCSLFWSSRAGFCAWPPEYLRPWLSPSHINFLLTRKQVALGWQMGTPFNLLWFFRPKTTQRNTFEDRFWSSLWLIRNWSVDLLALTSGGLDLISRSSKPWAAAWTSFQQVYSKLVWDIWRNRLNCTKRNK